MLVGCKDSTLGYFEPHRRGIADFSSHSIWRLRLPTTNLSARAGLVDAVRGQERLDWTCWLSTLKIRGNSTHCWSLAGLLPTRKLSAGILYAAKSGIVTLDQLDTVIVR
ncbi:predicted protein [Histoplasma capsulatum G186AR]|uniref:Uncharacterized protein n=1 Tax=Ajellomyces capsulatus (strain G186AR / H82 / ATCC MYA-2454 / RMSCC 2432) TaxID=447093 RepID=C0NRE1_AJECG|nr:uncharacterized protein HCBG_05571 [Histoplasma capsulatum G186AR]EEH06255.1 predicted protein [Histoplasma capsulatum G186AR]